jgi:pimeloyl-ACP methyl ester carboxylesterase
LFCAAIVIMLDKPQAEQIGRPGARRMKNGELVTECGVGQAATTRSAGQTAVPKLCRACRRAAAGSGKGPRSAVTATACQPLSTNAAEQALCWSASAFRAQAREALTADGCRVAIVQNPTMSLEDDAAVTRRVIDDLDGTVVLAGHSYGGAVITEAGLHDKAAALVYITAFAPDEGESVNTPHDPVCGSGLGNVSADGEHGPSWEGLIVRELATTARSRRR